MVLCFLLYVCIGDYFILSKNIGCVNKKVLEQFGTGIKKKGGFLFLLGVCV